MKKHLKKMDAWFRFDSLKLFLAATFAYFQGHLLFVSGRVYLRKFWVLLVVNIIGKYTIH